MLGGLSVLIGPTSLRIAPGLDGRGSSAERGSENWLSVLEPSKKRIAVASQATKRMNSRPKIVSSQVSSVMLGGTRTCRSGSKAKSPTTTSSAAVPAECFRLNPSQTSEKSNISGDKAIAYIHQT